MLTNPYSQLYTHVHQELGNQPKQTDFDVIVIGVGSMGAACCYHLAKRGYSVLGLEQFTITHEKGSHAGQSRITRKAYGESSDYVPLLNRAFENWKTLEQETQTQLFFKTEVAYFGAPQDPFLETIKKSAQAYKIPLNELSNEACEAKYPQFTVPDKYSRLVEPDAGLLTPERCILLLVEEAMKKGAIIRTQEKVQEWKRESGKLKVKTENGTYTSDKLIITAGAWSGKLVPELKPKLGVVRQVLAWMQPKRPEAFEMDQFPCWIIKSGVVNGYGFPILPAAEFGGPVGLKIGIHQGASEPTNPDAVNRTISAKDEKTLIDFMKTFIPDGYETILTRKTCLYTNSLDHDFIIDYAPGFGKDVAFAAGFSGHGFKFASVIGEVLADLVMDGKTELPIDFLSAERFG